VRSGGVAADPNLYHVKELLGHESLATVRHYANLTITDWKPVIIELQGKPWNKRPLKFKGNRWKRLDSEIF